MSKAGDRTMTVVEATVISDLLLRINHDLMEFECYESKLSKYNNFYHQLGVFYSFLLGL